MIFFRYLNRVLLFAFLMNLWLPFDVVAKDSSGKSKDAYSSKEHKGKKKKKDDLTNQLRTSAISVPVFSLRLLRLDVNFSD